MDDVGHAQCRPGAHRAVIVAPVHGRGRVDECRDHAPGGHSQQSVERHGDAGGPDGRRRTDRRSGGRVWRPPPARFSDSLHSMERLCLGGSGCPGLYGPAVAARHSDRSRRRAA